MENRGSTEDNDTGDVDLPKMRGRMAGVKKCYKQTLLNLLSQFKPTKMVLWGIISEKYRIMCDELQE